jgi:predicted transport protein
METGVVSGELVFSVQGAVASAALPISLADAGLRERTHLQEWVIDHPTVLGSDVKILAFEFGSWAAHSGTIERDRLDVLGLDGDGRLVVVELKRDKEPDTVDMQALKYAALVSRFTRDDLDKVHAQFLSRRRGTAVTPEEAAAELDEWAPLDDETLRLPRLVLMASEFPKTVTATVVFLHQQLGLDVRLLSFQAYRTATEILITVSQHYPPPEIEEFVLSPEVNEARQQRTERQSRQRETNTVARLLAADALTPGEELSFRAPSDELQAAVESWLADEPRRRQATWQEDPARPLVWAFDGAAYSPTGLARHILLEAAGRTSQVQGPLYWVNLDGVSLVELAGNASAGEDVPVESHLAKLSDTLRPVYDALDTQLRQLGPDITVRSRIRGFKYYAQRKLADLAIYRDHLSLYIPGLGTQEFEEEGLIVRVSDRYVHAQLRTLQDIPEAVALVKRAYARQSG